jgi:restriction system protein
MASKRIRTDDLIYIASRVNWRVGVGLALVSAVILHLVASTPASPVHATKIEDIKFAALRSTWWTFAAIGQFIVPLIFGIGALASYLAQSRDVTRVNSGRRDRKRESVK